MFSQNQINSKVTYPSLLPFAPTKSWTGLVRNSELKFSHLVVVVVVVVDVEVVVDVVVVVDVLEKEHGFIG